MPIVYDSNLMQYRWEPPGDDGPAYAKSVLPELAGTIVPFLGRGQQFGMGVGQVMPGWQDSPWSERYIQSQYQPMLGEYALNVGAYVPKEGAPHFTEEFGPWSRARMLSRIAGASGGVPAITPTNYAAAPPENWADAINVARTLRGINPLADTTTGMGDAQLGQWKSALEAEGAAEGLAAMATYDPLAGSYLGGVRQRALERAKQNWSLGLGGTQGGVGATEWDYLSALAQQDGPFSRFVREGYRV